MKKLTLSMFISIAAMNAEKVKMYKEHFLNAAKAHPTNKSLIAFIEKVNGKTMSHFISADEMNKTKAEMYETFMNDNHNSTVIKWG